MPGTVSGDNAIAFGPFRLFPQARLLEKDGVPLHIGGRALAILVFLAGRRGEVVGKREIVEHIWADVNVDEGSLRFHITALRKALGDTGKSARFVVNVAGRGYCFVASVTELATCVAAPHAEPSARHSLPAKLPKIIGREQVIQKIATAISTRRFISVVGPGGIGKTAVAVAVGHRWLAEFEGDAFFIDFGSLQDPSLAATTIASAVGLASSAEDPVHDLLTMLRARPALLILDNCEHVLETLAPLAERIVHEAPDIRLLATSRESFRSAEEWVFRLFPLDCPPQRDGLDTASILAYPAVQLFVERVAQSCGQFQLTDRDAPLVAEICRRLDGIALALELAASRVDVYGIAGTASLLDSRFSLQWRGRRTAVPRHQTLGAALDWSYDLLPETERATLRRLSVFAGSFTPEAAIAVASGDGIDASETIEAIDNLLTKSLIAPSATAPPRYRLLNTTRTYALKKLNDSGEAGQRARHHAAYFRDLFERANTDTSTRSTDWTSIHAGELDNLRAALDWAFLPDGDMPLGISLTAAAVTLWKRLSLFAECRERTTTALAALGDSADDDPIRRRLLAALGWALMFDESGPPEAHPVLAGALELADRLDRRIFNLRAIWGLCFDQFNNREFDGARDLAGHFADAAASPFDKTDPFLADRIMAVARFYLGN
ncbi:MAG: winged helix-turn-helix domain-containing protein [Bradyrhizobium sp.]|nr:winged helix-turn-helix domain-containing protein [Bradyrhizobium sp.]